MTKVCCMCATCWISKSIINGRNTNCECGSKDDHHTFLSEALFLPMKSPSNCTCSYRRWFSRALYFSYRCWLNLLVCALWLSLNAENDICLFFKTTQNTYGKPLGLGVGLVGLWQHEVINRLRQACYFYSPAVVCVCQGHCGWLNWPLIIWSCRRRGLGGAAKHFLLF